MLFSVVLYWSQVCVRGASTHLAVACEVTVRLVRILQLLSLPKGPSLSTGYCSSSSSIVLFRCFLNRPSSWCPLGHGRSVSCDQWCRCSVVCRSSHLGNLMGVVTCGDRIRHYQINNVANAAVGRLDWAKDDEGEEQEGDPREDSPM